MFAHRILKVLSSLIVLALLLGAPAAQGEANVYSLPGVSGTVDLHPSPAQAAATPVQSQPLPEASIAEPDSTNVGEYSPWQCWEDGSSDPCRNNDWLAIDLVSASDGWAVGAEGLLARWNGSQWLQFSSPVSYTLHGVDMLNAVDGWVVGDRGTLLHWDGSAWTRTGSPIVDSLRDVSVLAGNNAWVVGEQGNILHWNGASWLTVDSPVSESLYSIDMLASDDGWAVGESCFLHWNGTAWVKDNLQLSYHPLYSVDMVTSSDGWAVSGTYPGRFWHWDGVAWSQTGPEVSTRLNAVVMLSATDGWAVGGVSTDWGYDEGVIYHWDGSQWLRVSEPNLSPLQTIAMASAVDGWILGPGNFRLRWDGSSWIPFEDVYVWDDLLSLDMLSAQDGWAVGRQGKILRWDGADWITVTSPVTQMLTSVSMISADDGWSVGASGTILHWDGSSWSITASPAVTATLYGIDMLSAADGWAVGGELNSGGVILHWDGSQWNSLPITNTSRLLSIFALATDDAWAVGDSEIVHWDGNSWQQASIPLGWIFYSLSTVDMVASDDVWVASYGLFHWDGLNWTSYYMFGDLIRGVDFSNSTDGWLVGYGDSMHWDGAGLKKYPKPTSQLLYAVDMVTADSGWAVGGHGVILRYQPPATYALSGSVLDEHGRALPGATIMANGRIAATTNASGVYTLTETTAGAYSLTVGLNGYVFTPTLRQVAVPPPAGGLNFTGWSVEKGTWQCWGGLSVDPCQRSVNSLSFASASNGWAVGDSGALLHWNGAGWQVYPFPEAVYFTDVDVLPTGEAWAVGYGRSDLFTPTGQIMHWNGVTWQKVFTTDIPLSAVDMLSASEGWAVGGSLSKVILHWNGSQWQPQNVTLAHDAAVQRNRQSVSPASPQGGGGGWSFAVGDVSMVSNTDGWAVGPQGLILHWDGSSWQSLASPTTAYLYQVSMNSATDGWISGSGYPSSVLLHWDGAAWTAFTSPGISYLSQIAMLSTNDGWAVGADYTLTSQDAAEKNGYPDIKTPAAAPSGTNSRIQHWDGTAWQDVLISTKGGLNAIAMLSPSQGWIAGESGLILRWDGSQWSVSSPGRLADVDLNDVELVSNNEAWAVGGNCYGIYSCSGSEILHWDGATWVTFTNPTSASLLALDMLSAGDGWAVGGMISYSGGNHAAIIHWNGSAWTNLVDPPGAALRSLAMLTPNNGWAVGENGTILHWNGSAWLSSASPTRQRLNSVTMLAADNGWAVGECGAILHWNGTVWHGVDTPPPCTPLYGSVFASPSSGWAVGAGNYLLRWDGSRWQEMFYPQAFSQSDLYTAALLNGSDGWMLGGGIGLTKLLHWDGTSWTPVSFPQSDSALNAATFSGMDIGWAVGMGGKILRYYRSAGEQSLYLPIVHRSPAPVAYSLSGRVTASGGSPLAGVVVSAGGGRSATSAADGSYNLQGLPAGSYALTPSLSGYTFTPPSRLVSVPPSAASLDFEAAGQQQPVTIQIALNADDQDGYEDSYFFYISGDPRHNNFVGPTPQIMLGWIFPEVAVPPGAAIQSASVSFLGYGFGSATPRLQGFLETDAAFFTADGSNRPSMRQVAAASVDWSNDFPFKWLTFTTPDLKAMVQEVVNQAGWASGNNLGVRVSNPSGLGNGWGAGDFSAGSATHSVILSITYIP